MAKPCAFVLGLGENGYGILRALARHGIGVFGFYSEAKEFGRFSRYVQAQRLAPESSDEEICATLIERGRGMAEKPVLLPTSDRYAFLLSRFRESLAAHFRFYPIEEQVLERIADKAEVGRVCAAAGVPAPRTYIMGSAAALPDPLPFSFPWLIKPNRSFDTPFPAGLKNFVAASREDLMDFYAGHPQARGATVCQEIIEGDDENIFQCTVLILASGQPGAVFCARKLHQYRPGYGVMCFGRSEDNRRVSEQALRLLRALDYRGWASVEFKYRARDDTYYFIEMNPRLPWYNALFADAGVNIAYLTYLDLTGRKCPRARQRDGVYWISFKLDLGWFLLARAGSRHVPFAAWLKGASRASSYAWFDRHDAGPFVRATGALVSAGLRKPLR
jgi:D-aspartate ligase